LTALTPELRNSRFLRAARCEPTDTTPVWIMRQAGRYLPEYMAVRRRVTFLELCKRPELAAEVTLTAREVLGVDAAILFADLLPILEPLGFHLEYQHGEGPVIHNPIESAADVDRVRVLENPQALGYVFDAIRLIRRDLPADIPLLGFAGAPFTLASYAIEGGGSKNYLRTKRLMWGDPPAWETLMQRLVDSTAAYLRGQIEAGCQAVQVFDSWAGCLAPDDYRTCALPHTRRLLAALPPDVPVIHFLTGNPGLLPLQREAGGQVLGIDWRVDLAAARRLAAPDRAVQGNLDPAVLLCEPSVWQAQVQRLLRAAGPAPGYIFNLGHGVLPETPPEHVKELVQKVHEWGAR
jgi:uroporphyrinogen decarboxylase